MHHAALNFYIKAQCASPFHHLFIWANSIVYRESMIFPSKEIHTALHPQKPLYSCKLHLYEGIRTGRFATNMVVGSSGTASDL